MVRRPRQVIVALVLGVVDLLLHSEIGNRAPEPPDTRTHSLIPRDEDIELGLVTGWDLRGLRSHVPLHQNQEGHTCPRHLYPGSRGTGRLMTFDFLWA